MYHMMTHGVNVDEPAHSLGGSLVATEPKSSIHLIALLGPLVASTHGRIIPENIIVYTYVLCSDFYHDTQNNFMMCTCMALYEKGTHKIVGKNKITCIDLAYL